MKKKLLALLLTAVLALSLLPTSALADAVERPVITNYEELVAAENSTETYYFIPKAEFGWPEEETEVSITADLRMSSGGSWVIPEQATVNLSGKLQQDRSTPASVTVNGTLNLLDKMLLNVHQITIAGTLTVTSTSATINADEGEALSTATFNLIPVTDTTPSTLCFYQGPKYIPTHWVFHEGITFLGTDTRVYDIGEFAFREGLFETDGAVNSMYTISSRGATLKGDWTVCTVKVNPGTLNIDGNVNCLFLRVSGGSDPAILSIPEGSTVAVERRENYGSIKLTTDRNAQILVNGTLRMGHQLNVELNGTSPIVGTGVVDARANNSWGNQQPVFLADGAWIKMDDIDWDRAAYANLIAESLTIQKSWATRPALTKPASVTVNAGEEAVFSVEAKYTDSYQWCYKTSADSTESFECTDAMGTGADTNTFRLVAKPEYDGYVFFCRGYNSENSHSSATATLTVLGPAVEITAQPQDYVGALNSTATFTVAAEGENLAYQWQISDDGENWTNSSVKSAKYSTKLTQAKDGRMVRCVITDPSGASVTSDTATMSISKLAITQQPQNYVGKVNSTATFLVTAEGEGLHYQWQVSTNGGKSWSASSVTQAKYAAKLTGDKDGRMVRCIVADQFGQFVISSPATMHIATLSITTQPKDYTGALNSQATFTVAAKGTGTLHYQWEVSTNGGKSWSKSSVTSAKYSAKLTSEKDNRMVRCIVTDDYGNSVTSSAATMHIATLSITTQPVNYTGAVDSTAKFTVVAKGSGTLHYQWEVSTNGGKSWSKSSVTSAVYAAKLTAEKDGRMVRCIVTDNYGNSVTSNAVTMKIAKLTITTQPKNYKGALNSQATFTVAATGVGTLHYQWEVSTNGGKSWSKSSITAAKYSTKLTAEKDGRMVRCIVSDNNGSVISNAASMKITTLSIVTQPVNYKGALNSTATFTVVATGEGLTYQWQVSTNNGATWSKSSVTSAVYAAKLTAEKDGRMVRCIVTDKNGNSVTSSAAKMTIG